MDQAPDAFEQLERAIATARAAIRQAENADGTAQKIAFDGEQMKVIQDASYHCNTNKTPEQETIQAQMVAARKAAIQKLSSDARTAAFSQAIESLERLRRSIPHLVVPAMVELGAKAGSLRRVVSSQQAIEEPASTAISPQPQPMKGV